MSRLTTVNSNYFETANLNGTVVTFFISNLFVFAQVKIYIVMAGLPK